MKRIKRFGIWQAAKVGAVIYFILSAIFIIPVWIFGAMFSALVPESYDFSAMFLLLMPFIYAIVGFIVSAVSCVIYNITAGWIGGIEVEIEEITTIGGTYAQSSPPQV